MGINCGIVGLPNVGKSTLFNALTKAKIEAANYPFCTIDPNVGMVPVPDPRQEKISDIVKPERIVPAMMEFVDIAGLVKGAAEGEGLGNQFLGHIRSSDAILHVVRCFDSDDITHVSGKIDPIDDIETINTELVLADLQSISKSVLKAQKNAKSGDKTAKTLLNLLEKLQKHLDQGLSARSLKLDSSEQELIGSLQLITSKPILYIANVDDNDISQNKFFAQVQEYAKNDNSEVIPVCAAIEAELVELDETDKQDFLAELGLDEPALNKLIRASYKLLGLQTYFTAGEKEVRAWTVKVGATAPQAAGEIHTDFEKGFIRAEVVSYNDFINNKGFAGAKDAGKWRLEGKDYIVQDGDVMLFRFNV